MKETRILQQEGQTSVEYILMIAVVIFIATGIFRQLEGFLISDPDSLKNSYLGNYKDMFSGENGSYQGQYRRFSIKK